MFGDWNNEEAVLKAANYCSELREKCLVRKKSFVFETVFSAQDKIDFVIRAKEAGFERGGKISRNNAKLWEKSISFKIYLLPLR